MATLDRPANFRLLHAFCAVARHLSFTGAAAELQRSQATLSVQVRELEQQLRVPLLIRTTRRVKLTEAGQRLAEGASAGFAAIDAAWGEVSELGQARRNRVVLACVPSLSSSRLPPLLAKCREANDQVRIDVRELTSHEMFEALLARQVDFGIGPCPDPPPPGIGFSLAVEDPLYIVLSEDSNRWGCAGIPFESLAELPLITLSGSVLLQESLESVAAEHSLQLRTGTEVRHMQTAIAMAQAGVGAAVAPRLALPDRVGDGLAVLPIIEPRLSRRVGLITRAGAPLDPLAARIARYLRAGFARQAPPSQTSASR